MAKRKKKDPIPMKKCDRLGDCVYATRIFTLEDVKRKDFDIEKMPKNPDSACYVEHDIDICDGCLVDDHDLDRVYSGGCCCGEYPGDAAYSEESVVKALRSLR